MTTDQPTFKRLTKEEAEAIIEARRAKVKRARAELMQRLADEVRPALHGQLGHDQVADRSAEVDLAEKIIATYMDGVPGGEASFAELRELLLQFAIDPRLVMAAVGKMMFADENE
jgi:hypothetical protein